MSQPMSRAAALVSLNAYLRRRIVLSVEERDGRLTIWPLPSPDFPVDLIRPTDRVTFGDGEIDWTHEFRSEGFDR